MDVMSKLSNYYKAYKPLLIDLIKKTFPSHRKALNDLDKKLQRYLNFKNGFFIEAGAFDGVTQSNTYFLEKAKNWNGILIEPILENFEKISLNRNSETVNCALVDETYHESHIIMNYAGLMTVADNAMEPDQLEKHVITGNNLHGFEKSYKIKVITRTLSSIIEEFGSPKVDFLSLDVEGAENMVLEGIDFSRHRPSFILIEERDHAKTKSLLGKAKYRQLEQFTEHDFLYSDANH
jgi:FkbM family methyltransferase